MINTTERNSSLPKKSIFSKVMGMKGRGRAAAHLAAPSIDHKDIQSELVCGVERMRFTYVQVQVSLQSHELFR